MAEDPRASEQADLAALADGTLASGRRRAVEARVAASPAQQAALDRQRAALAEVRAAGDERAPDALRTWLREQEPRALASPRWPARPGPLSPARRPRRPRPLALAATLVAGALVLVATLALLTGLHRSDVEDLARAAARPADAPAPARAPGGDLLLAASADGIPFPDWEPQLGWRATGVRTDEISSRRAVTVRYTRGGRSVAYAILARPAVELPAGDGRYRPLVHEGRPAVAWHQDGRTCLLLAGAGVDGDDLRALAASTRFY